MDGEKRPRFDPAALLTSSKPPTTRVLTSPMRSKVGVTHCHVRGQSRGLFVKYNEALEYAPKWKELKEARDAVTKQKS
jgi:hypothetical protein